MSRLKAFYAVPRWMRILTGGAALIVAASLPLIATSSSIFEVMFVAFLGVFAASIAIFGRLHRQDRSNNSSKPTR